DVEAIRIDTELIQLDVVVTDKKGNIVNNLTKEDFELLEDGKLQDISFFSIVRPKVEAKSTVKSPISTSKNIPIDVPLIEQSGRNFIILVDDLHISTGNIVNVRKQLLNLINTQFQVGDRVAVISTGGGLGFLQQLTDDPRVMRRAVERLRSQVRPTVPPNNLAELTEFQAQKILEGELDPLELAVMRYYENVGIAIPRTTVERDIQTTARQIVDALNLQTTATLQTIRNNILALKSVPGRKTMILVSDGFLLEPREADHYQQMQRIVDSATRAGVVIYSLGSDGLGFGPNNPFGADKNGFDRSGVGIGISTSLASREQFAGLTVLNNLAADTGGVSIINTNDLSGGLKRIVDESSSYYLLAYYPTSVEKDGKFKKFQIKIKIRKDLTIKTRKGYFSGGEKIDLKELAKKEKIAKEQSEKNKINSNKSSTNQEQVENTNSITTNNLLQAMTSILPVKDVNLKLKADFLGHIDSTKDNSAVSLAVNLSNINFNKVNNNYQNKLNSLLVVVAENGKIVHSSESNLDLNLTEARYKQIGKAWFFFSRTLTLKPGFYNIRFALRDPISNKLGSATTWVEVPDLEKSKLALSNILLLHSDSSAKDVAPNISGSGQALNIFSEKSSIGFLCYVFDNKASKKIPELTAQVQILQGDKALFTSPQIDVVEKLDKTGRIAYGGSLPLMGFPSGQYQLKITINDAKGKKQVSQEQDFTIE
ncbi:MAG: VWA domain-containing protein, partial [Blastocatellia bacterium]